MTADYTWILMAVWLTLAGLLAGDKLLTRFRGRVDKLMKWIGVEPEEEEK